MALYMLLLKDPLGEWRVAQHHEPDSHEILFESERAAHDYALLLTDHLQLDDYQVHPLSPWLEQVIEAGLSSLLERSPRSLSE